MALKQIGLAFFSGLEGEKPAAFTAANTGATFYATDTKKLWIYDAATSGWAVALEPLHIVEVGVGQGAADLTTTPMASPTNGAWYTTTAPGDYIKFTPPTGGLIGVAKGDVIIWDGSAWTLQAASNLVHHSNGMVSTPQASIASISGGGDKVLVTKEYVLSSAIGAMEYKGTWNASTNVPPLPRPSSNPVTGNKGWFYIVDTAGKQSLPPNPPGTMPIDYAVGDWVMSDGTNWDKVDNTSSVASVFGRTGVIVSQAGDYALAQITGLQTALDLKAPLASPTFTGTVSGIDKAMVGLTDVDDTSDADKPVSTAQQTEIDTKEDDLGAPTTDGQILSSTIAKVRTWIDAPSGGGVTSFNTRTGAVVPVVADYATLYEGILAAPTKDGQILASQIDKTKSWVDLPSAEKGGIAHSATTDYVVGDIVSEGDKVYRCITAHTKKAFDATEWFALDEEVTVQPAPTAPGELTGTPTLAEINAILTYSKEISAVLVAAGVFEPPSYDIDIESSAATLQFLSTIDFDVTLADGTKTSHTGNAAAQAIPATVGGWTSIVSTGDMVGARFDFKSESHLTKVKLNNIGSITTLKESFNNCSNMTSFECAADTSNVTDFTKAWYGCGILASFPHIDTSKGMDFSSAWASCSSLTSFPLLDTSNVTNFAKAWFGCGILASFPHIDTSNVTDFRSAWNGCSVLTSFPLLDTSAGRNFDRAWNDCLGLTSFPLLDTSKGTIFTSAWASCSSLTSFPLLDTSAGTGFAFAWYVCEALACFAELDLTALTVGTRAFSGCRALTAPAITGTPVRANDDAKAGIWTNPGTCP